MSTISFAENYYSYGRVNVISTEFIPTTAAPDAAVLSQINALLTQAAADYAARRYQTAIVEYQQAESLIFQHLDPSFGGGDTVAFPHDPALFDPLLSASVEWLNKLSPIQPTVPVVSRIPIDHGLLGVAGTLDTGRPAQRRAARRPLRRRGHERRHSPAADPDAGAGPGAHSGSGTCHPFRRPGSRGKAHDHVLDRWQCPADRHGSADLVC